jgi:D-arabinose 1-dehydrogenase-like Zn-dependent alcohol dehydrogenase
MNAGTMLAARAYEGEQEFRLEQIDVPKPEAGDVVVAVMASGLTHGLLNLWRMRGRIKLLPAVLSQEIAGTVFETGAGVSAWQPGDRVRVHTTLSCRNCDHCRAGNDVWCDEVSLIGHAVYSVAAMPLYERYHNGGLAQFVKVPEWSLDRLPENVSFEVAAKLHSVAVTHQALRRADLEAGDTLLITGASGAQGAIAVRLAPQFGVARVVAVARTRRNLERVQKLGLPGLVEILTLDELSEDWEKQGTLSARIRSLTGGRGADALVDFLPAAPAVTVQSIYALKKGASAVLVGGNWNPIALLYGMIMNNGWQIKGSQGASRADAKALLDLLADGRLELDDLVTDVFPLREVNAAVELIDNRSGAPLLVAVAPMN